MKRLSLLLMIACAAFGACGDDTPGPSDGANQAFARRIAGDYTAQTDSFGGILYWWRFRENGCHTYLTEHGNGWRSVRVRSWSVEDSATGRVRIAGTGYTATLAMGDSLLTLVSDHEGDTYVITRSSGMPNPSEWVREIQLVDSFPPPDPAPTELAWNGGLWYSGVQPGTLVRLDPANGLQADSVLTVQPSGLNVARAGEDFWVNDAIENKIYLVSGGDGSTRRALDYVARIQVNGLAVRPDGHLWVGDGGRAILLDPVTGDSVDAVEAGASPRGLEAVGDTLFAAIGGFGVVRIEGPPWRVTATYKLPDFNIRGLAFDGSEWWLSVTDMRGPVTSWIVRARFLETWLATADGSC